MKECLNCKKGFEQKKETKKFCSDSCRVMWNRKHGKKGAIKPIQMQVLYNSILEAVGKINSLGGVNIPSAPLSDQNQALNTYQSNSTKPVIRRSYEYYVQEKLACETMDEWEILKSKIEDDPYLTLKQKNFLIKNN